MASNRASDNAAPLIPVASPRLLARNTAINFLGHLIVATAAVVLLPMIILHLGPDQFGLLSLALTAFASFSLLDLGLSRATTKFVAATAGELGNERISSIMWTTVLVQVIAGVAGGVALIMSSGWITAKLHLAPELAGQAEQTLKILGVSVPVVLVAASFRGALEGAQRFGTVNIIRVALNLSTYILPLAGGLLSFSIPSIVMMMLLARTASMGGYAFACFRCIPGFARPAVMPLSESRALFAFSGWVAVSNVIVPFLVQVDRYLIAMLVSVSAVTYYVVPFELLSGLWIIPASFSAVLLPVFSGIHDDRRRSIELFQRSVKYILLALGAAVAVLGVFASDVMLLWQGPAFAEQSTTVMRVLLAGVLVNSLGWVPTNLLLAANRPDLPAKVHLIQLPLYLGAAYWLISKYGILGAAVAFLIRVMLEAALLFYFKQTLSAFKSKVFPSHLWAALMALMLLTGFTTLAARASSPPRQMAGTTIALVLFTILAWLRVFDEKDRELARSFFAQKALRISNPPTS